MKAAWTEAGRMPIGCGRFLGLLALAGCLSAPPSTTGDGPTDDDAAPADAGSRSLLLTGIATRDALTVDGRDELVLIGRRNDAPVAVVLYPGEEDDLSKVAVVEVPLSFDPIDAMIVRWDASTGIAVLLGPGGQLAAIDPTATLIPLTLSESGVPTSREFRHLSQLDGGGDHRLVLADGAEVLVSDPLGVGQPGEQPIPIVPVATAVDPVLLGSSYAGGRWTVGVVETDREVDVYPITFEPPTAGPDRVLDQLIPVMLERALWRMSGTRMVLIGIDQDVPEVWYHSAAMDETLNMRGSVLAGVFEVFHDLLLTRVNDGAYDFAIAGDGDGGPQVLLYLDPIDAVPESLPPALAFVLTGLEPTYFLEAMDVVLDPGQPSHNEIIAYDTAGHLTCIDLVGLELQSCGTLDLENVTASGASTSGRPGW